MKKKKPTVWHKKKGKTVPPSIMKTQPLAKEKEGVLEVSSDSRLDRKKAFFKKLSLQIKKAVNSEHLK